MENETSGEDEKDADGENRVVLKKEETGNLFDNEGFENEISNEDDDVIFIEEVINNPESKFPVNVKLEPDMEVNSLNDLEDDLLLQVSNETESIDIGKNGGSSDRMDVLKFVRPQRKMRSTGVKSRSRVGDSKNGKINPLFFEKHPYFDDSALMCSAQDIEKFIGMNGLQYMRDKIAPWFTTAQPICKVERRYWTYVVGNGIEWVSRARVQHKFFFRRGAPIDENDKCVICEKYLLCEYHQYMHVFMYSPDPDVDQLWLWMESELKACAMHFYSSKAKFIPGRSPYNWEGNSVNSSRSDEVPELHGENFEVDETIPDEY